MRRTTAVLAALAVVAFAAVTTWVGSISGAPPQFLIADAVGGLTFLAAGFAAVLLRPASPAGPALMASAALWFLGSYGPTGQPVLTDIGFAFEGWYDLVLAALLLQLTGGIDRGARPLVAALAGAMALRSLGRLVFKDPAQLGCPDCPPNPFALFPDADRFLTSEIATNAAIAAFAVAIGLIAIVRLSGQGAVARRARGPILVAGTLAMAGAAYDAAEYAWSTAMGSALITLPEPASEIFAWTIFGLRVLVPIGFLAGTLRVRARAGPLAPLAAGLAGGAPASIGDALRATLGDASLHLYRPAGRGWQGEGGQIEPSLPQERGRAVTIVGPADAPLAALAHDPALREQAELLDGTVRVLALALENERLGAEVRAQLQEVTESRVRIVAAAQAERQRVERDLHDGAQQRLIGVLLQLQQARAAAGSLEAGSGSASGSEANAELVARIEAATEELNAAVRELRELARGIHPAILEEEGLGPAITGLARRASLPVTVDVRLEGRLPRLVEATAYFTVAEALTNAQRHARATEASIRVTRQGGAIEVEVRDDGMGGADPVRGSGLRGLSDRVTALGGRLSVESAPRAGTSVLATIPVP